MLPSMSNVNARCPLFKKCPLWVVVLGLIFGMGSLIAQDTDTSDGVDSDVEEEQIATDESNEDGKTESDVSDAADENKASKVSTQDETTLDEDVVKKSNKTSVKEVAEEKEKKKNPETGSNLPNGDPTSNVIRITGDGIRDFFWQVEYLRDR